MTGLFGDTLAGLTFDKEFKAQRKQSGGGGGAHSTSVGQGLEGAAKVRRKQLGEGPIGSSWKNGEGGSGEVDTEGM